MDARRKYDNTQFGSIVSRTSLCCRSADQRLEADRMSARYDRRQTSDGYVVFDLWTGETVIIAGVAQNDLSSLDAEELVGKLNERAAAGMRDLLQ